MIPKNWEGSDFYRDLGIRSNATQSEIKSAYRRLVREYHPDLNDDNDRSEKFRKITDAYNVLSNPIERNKYDDYLSIDNFVENISRRKGTGFGGFLARISVFILVLFLLKNFGLIALPQNSIQSTNTGNSNSSNGNSKNYSSNNQVLALMVGPQGPPGPAGVTGKDGFVGLNGYQGKDGIPGAPGATGEQGPIGPEGKEGKQGIQGIQGAQGVQGVEGAGVAIVSLSSNSGDSNYDSNCPAGGTKLISSSGTISYACNGTGGGGGGSGSLGLGYVQIGTCDSSVKMSLESAYRTVNNGAQDFTMDAIVIDELAGLCDTQELTAILKIKNSISGGLNASGTRTYYASDSIGCSATLDLDLDSGVNANSVSLTWSDCYNITHPSSTFRLFDILARDVSEAADGLLLQIA